MVYDGFFTLGGTELFNAERTKAYVREAMPLFGITTECCECVDLAAALGEGPYISPVLDPAPWYSPYTPGSGEFYGLLPLSVEGVDDGTIGATITELTTDGAVVSRPRRSSRMMRFTGLLIGETTKSLDVGMTWLKSVLTGSECSEGDCGGDDLCYLAACPTVVSFEGYPTVILDQPYGNGQWTSTKGWTGAPGTTVVPTPFAQDLRLTNLAGTGPVAWVMMQDLVPGGTYRVQIRVRFPATGGPAVVRLPGAVPGKFEIFYTELDALTGSTRPVPADGGVGVFEFQATSRDQVMELTGPANVAPSYLDSVLVTRVAGQGVTLSTQPNSGLAAEVGAWTAGSTGSGSFYVSQVMGYGLANSAVVSSGAGTFEAASPWLRRSLAGLTPGRTYTLTVAARTRSASGSGLSTDRGLRVWLDNGLTSSSPQIWQSWTPSGGVNENQGWLQLQFVATAPSHQVYVAPNTAWAVPTGGYLTWVQVEYMRVEQDLSGVEIQDPDPGAELRRYLRNVTAYSGPTVTGEFAPIKGAMRQVEFTLVAGDPRPLGETRLIAAVLGSGVDVVPEMGCSQGEPVLTNYVQQPSFGLVSNYQWTATGSPTVTWTSVVVPDAVAGTRVGRITVTSAASGAVTLTTDDDVPVAVGATYTMSIYVRSSVAATATVQPIFNGNVTGPGGSADLVAGGAWVRLSSTYTIPNATTAVQFQVMLTRPTAFGIGAIIDVDAAMLVDGARLGPYFDGFSQFGDWTGVVNDSTSVWARSVPTLIVDPDCPPIPAPPRPPLIPTDCIEAPAMWRRYTATIPAQVTGVSPVSLPAIAMSTGSSPARGVRLRFVANPFGLPPEMLDPCTYCGEFIVSYLPANTTLTVDAAGRTVTMAVAGGEPQSAMHLLYGSDGGPVTWPALSCGIEYMALVDLDADVPGPLVDLQLSVTPAY